MRLIRDLTSYDPRRDLVTISAGSSPYERYHEAAHRAQAKARTDCWRMEQALHRIPYLCRLARLVLEWEAMELAHRAMRRDGVAIDPAEGRRHLMTYAWALLW